MGTTSQKLSYLNDTKGKLKDSINKFRDGITDQTTFRDYATELDGIYDKLPKVDNTSDASQLLNAQNGLLDDFKMYGNTQQDSYTGKNLLNPNLETNTKNGITCTYDPIDQTYTFNGSCTADNTGFKIGNQPIYFTNEITTVSAYWLGGNVTTYCVFRTFDAYYGRNTPIDLIDLSSSNPIKSETCNGTNYTAVANGMTIRFNNGSVANNLKVKFMIADSTDTTYEPYVGGVPSPNPDYPQNINVVSGNQVVNVSGKNKLPFPYTQSTITHNGVTFTVNNDGSVLVNGTASADENASIKLYGNYQEINQMPFTGKYLSGGTNVVRLRAFNNTGNIYTVLGNDTGSGAEIDTTTYTKGYIELTVLKGTTADNVLIKPMVLDSLDDTTYEPYYTPQNYTIGLGSMELCKIDTYKDSIKKSTGKNLFDKDSVILGKVWNGASNTKRAYGYIEAIQGQVYTASTQDTSSDLNIYITETAVIGTGGNHIKQTELTSTLTFTPQSDTKYIVVQFTATTNDITQEMVNNALIQIEENNQATDYEPFGTNWYIKKEIGKVVLDGSENWGLNSDNIPFYNLTNSYNGAINLVIPNGYSNYFTLTTGVITSSNSLIGISASASGKYFRIRLETMLSLNDFKTWLSTHNTEVYYILATPTYETITNETLISQLESIKVNTGSNYFTLSNSNNVLPNIYAKRLKKLDSLT